MNFSPVMALALLFSFLGFAFFMGMLIHSAFIYEDKKNIKRDSKKAWVLSMAAGLGITFWMFLYGFYANRPSVMQIFFGGN
ncbi:MAG: hypothetical protein ACE5GQ_03725 [Nitrospinales bacterium]